ncbi:hypothetical protein PVK06_001000 [Gossypium arboreum]|uniref:Uncharacterized protein n=1 Tax=Gossypium arboreum TaxID=29729 RepID=A0ABR0QZV4_GOSAR|nr:hypothetical protein PVK06_001000 [Gossypium arboreum]
MLIGFYMAMPVYSIDVFRYCFCIIWRLLEAASKGLHIGAVKYEMCTIIPIRGKQEMMKNPRILEKEQAEVRQAYDRTGDVSESDLHELTYLNKFISRSVDYKGANFEFISFGAGRRMCLGISYGMAVLETP